MIITYYDEIQCTPIVTTKQYIFVKISSTLMSCNIHTALNAA